MDRDREIPYLSDEELMALIDGIEQTPGEYVRAPEYMEERILAAVSEEERKENGRKVDEPSEHALTPEEKRCPSSQSPVPAMSASSWPLSPRPELELVQKGITVLPEKSLASIKPSTGQAAMPHQMG